MFHIQIILWLSQSPVYKPVLAFLRGASFSGSPLAPAKNKNGGESQETRLVSWLASLSSSSVSPLVLCDTWRYSRIIPQSVREQQWNIHRWLTSSLINWSVMVIRTNQIASQFFIASNKSNYHTWGEYFINCYTQNFWSVHRNFQQCNHPLLTFLFNQVKKAGKHLRYTTISVIGIILLCQWQFVFLCLGRHSY